MDVQHTQTVERSDAPVVLKIQAGCVGFAAEFQSREETRPYLMGVRIEPCPTGGIVAVAVDGHRLVAIHDPAGSVASPVTIQFPIAFLAACRRKPDQTLNFDGMIARLSEASDVCCPALVVGEFPEWRKVVPAAGKKSASPVFQARYVASFRPIAQWLGGGVGGAIHIAGADAEAPALVTFASDKAIGVIMPLRAPSAMLRDVLPAWLSTEKPKVRVKAARTQRIAA